MMPRIFYTVKLLTLTLLAAATLAPADSSAASAPTAGVVYVTDELRLGLYRTEETNGRALKTLVSGSRLEILERSLMSIRVRTEDGDEGWVKTAYIVEAEPARRRLATLETLQAENASALAASQAEVEQQRTRLESLARSLADAEQGIEELPSIREENAELKAALKAEGITIALRWLLLIAVLTFALGIVLGYWWLDRKLRAKFGGVRVV